MLTEIAVVLAYEQGIAQVKCQSQTACGSCAAKSACGTAALSELTGERGEHIFQIETITPLNVGQKVEIGLSEQAMLSSAILLYFVPLCSLLLSVISGGYLFSQELQTALFAFVCTALSFLIVRKISQKWQKNYHYRPILLRVL